jgi:hypothetical protein
VLATEFQIPIFGKVFSSGEAFFLCTAPAISTGE